jgi:hypothetical protein
MSVYHIVISFVFSHGSVALPCFGARSNVAGHLALGLGVNFFGARTIPSSLSVRVDVVDGITNDLMAHHLADGIFIFALFKELAVEIFVFVGILEVL